MHIRAPILMPGAMPSASALLGTAAGSEILQEINSRIGATFIGTRYNEVDNAFMRNVIMPTRQALQVAQKTVAVLSNQDLIVPLDTIDAFEEVPSSMYLPILLYPPVRSLLERGRVDGWGIDPSLLPEGDAYGRLINNGRIEDLQTALNASPDGCVEFVSTWTSDDPDLSFDDLDAIEITRNTIDRILQDTEYDPTNIESVRG